MSIFYAFKCFLKNIGRHNFNEVIVRDFKNNETFIDGRICSDCGKRDR